MRKNVQNTVNFCKFSVNIKTLLTDEFHFRLLNNNQFGTAFPILLTIFFNHFISN